MVQQSIVLFRKPVSNICNSPRLIGSFLALCVKSTYFKSKVSDLLLSSFDPHLIKAESCRCVLFIDELADHVVTIFYLPGQRQPQILELVFDFVNLVQVVFSRVFELEFKCCSEDLEVLSQRLNKLDLHVVDILCQVTHLTRPILYYLLLYVQLFVKVLHMRIVVLLT